MHLDPGTLYVIATALFASLFGFFGIVIRELKQTKFIIEQIRELRSDFNDHLEHHERKVERKWQR